MPTHTRRPSRRRVNPTDWFGYSVADEIKVTIAHTPITQVRDVSGKQTRGWKPIGLWYACGGEWIEWLESEMPEWLEDGKYLYEVRPNYSVGGLAAGHPRYADYVGGVLRLSTEEEVVEFSRTYSNFDKVDWHKVASIWDGIEICPYQSDLRLSMHNWYYTWDVASGCIWRPSGLASPLGLLKSRESASASPRRGVDRGNPRRNPYPSREEFEAAKNRFYDALEAEAGEGQTHYFGPFVVIGDQTGDVLGKLELDVWQGMPDGGLAVSLSYIGVNRAQRQQGRGTRLMQVVLAAADAAGLPVTLTVSPQKEYGDARPAMNKKQLRDFYKKFGFATVRGMGPDYMVRFTPSRVNPRRR